MIRVRVGVHIDELSLIFKLALLKFRAESENMGVCDGRWLVKSLPPEEMPTLLTSASFAVNSHFSSFDG